ncbi:MAG: single-stranded DNA-binding protein [Litorilinea sp.]
MYQQITLVGNLGNDPEMRYTPSGVPVTNFNVAVSRRWTGQDGQSQEKTTWFRVTAWRRQAELASQYLTKGRQVLVVGEVEEAEVWTDREGNARASLNVTANSIQFLGSRSDGSGGGSGNYNNESGGNAGGNAGNSGNAGNGGNSGGNVTEEDIPF